MSADPIAPFKTAAVEGYHQFLPAQPFTIGSLLPSEKFPQNAKPPKLFEPLKVRGVELFPTRMAVSPMCQYSSDNGHATDHHFVHLGSMAMRGWSNIMVEASAVVPEGRITEHDAGIWTDSQIAPLKRIVDYVHGLGGKIGIQLAHAGRKASTLPPWTERIARDEGWEGGCVTSEENGGWPSGVYAPSAQTFHEGNFPEPVAADDKYIQNMTQAFVDATERCKKAGFDFIEIHGAHGYLIHEFLSPISNKRTDKYGGSLENRFRLPLEITKAVRAIWDGPLFFRASASDWLEEVEGPEVDANGDYHWWGIEQTTMLAKQLQDLGIDLFDVSSGGNDLRGKIKIGPSYQVPFAEHIKKNVPGLLVGAVGLITDAAQANDIVESGQADIVFFARELLRNIDFPLKAAEELGAAVSPAVQYERAWTRMVVKRDHLKAEAHHGGKDEVEGEEGKGGKESGRG